MVGDMEMCPRCNMGMEWGKKRIKSKIIYFWRCSWCGYQGGEITRL